MKFIQNEMVKSRKKLEEQGYAKIVSNDWYQYGDEGEWKYVLEMKEDYKIALEGTITFASRTIGELCSIYNYGLVHDPKDEYDRHMYKEIKNQTL